MVAKRRKKRTTGRKGKGKTKDMKKTAKTGTKTRRGRKAQKKVVFIVVDGLADTPVKGKTPLSEAKKENIDWFAANGSCGELSLVGRKEKVASHIANVNLLGYSSKRYPINRGPLEAVGAGVPYKEGHLAVRCNFATVDRNMIITDRRAGRNTYGLDEIARDINRDVKIGPKYVFMRTYGHRAVLIIKKRLSDEISENDTALGKPVGRIEALSTKAEESARLVQSFIDKSRDMIQFHQKNSERMDKGIPAANYLLVRQPGNKLFALPNFAKRWNIKNAVCISENGVMKATCMLAGFNSMTVPEFDDHSKWLDYIFENIDSALAEYDFVYAHIKGADQAAHDKKPEEKKKVIEDIDRRLEGFRNFGGILVLTCDHITSSKSGNHEYGPVPVFVYGRKKDAVKKFDEKSVKHGSLGRMSGRELMKYIFGK